MTTQSIRFRLVVWYSVLLTVVFVLLGTLIYAGLKHYLIKNLGQTQARRAQQMAETLLLNVEKTGEAHVVEEINSWVTPEINDRFVRITRGDGSILYVSRDPKDLSFQAKNVPPYPQPVNKISWQTDDSGLIVAAVPCQSSSGKSFLVEVGVPLKSVELILHQLIVLLTLGLVAMVGISIGSGYFLVSKSLAPVDQIGRSAESISLHNLSGRLPIAKTGDELERLSISLNNMIARLETAVQHNQRFLADVSHELRTPLTIINGELESVVEELNLSEKAQHDIASAMEEVERMTRIVESLLSMSHLEAGETEKGWVQFDLAELSSTTLEQMIPLAEDKKITLRSNISRNVLIEADRSRLKQVIVNLLDNAIKYTPAGGEVVLTVSQKNELASLEISDNGIGIPEKDQPKVFERFFRVDKARSRELGGAGLGLSIVKAICAAFGGVITVNSVEGKGSRFEVQLPLAKQDENPKPAEAKNNL